MKKTIIAGLSIVSLGAAAIPFTGVFAVTEHTDIVTVTVSPSCSMTVTTASGWNSTTGYSTTITNGNKAQDIGGTQMSVTCNSSTGWKLQAIGAGAVSGDAAAMQGSGTANGINFTTGTAISGATSAWAMKVTGTGASSTYNTNYAAVPKTTAAIVASGAGGVSGNTLTAKYQVYISPTQAAGTYTGKVKYTVSAGQS